MSLKLKTITFFVEDVEKSTKYYSDILSLKPDDIRKGWSAYKVSRDFRIAFHKGRGRHPRFNFVTNKDLVEVRQELNAKGAKLGAIKDLGDGKLSCKGRDPDGLMIQIDNK